jgi:AcrR family transcriptional regulator
MPKTSHTGRSVRRQPRVSELLELKKESKRRRIVDACYELFTEHGFDGTTMRQISQHAGVALGTLSLYARDKRDLVLLLFNEHIPAISDAAEQAARRESDFIEQLLSYFRELNRFFLRNINISKIHLQLNYYKGGMHSDKYYAERQRLFDFVEECVKEAQRNEVISASKDPVLIAKLFFFTYSAALRWWLATDKPKLETSIDELRPLFELQMSGLHPTHIRNPKSSKRSPNST